MMKKPPRLPSRSSDPDKSWITEFARHKLSALLGGFCVGAGLASCGFVGALQSLFHRSGDVLLILLILAVFQLAIIGGVFGLWCYICKQPGHWRFMGSGRRYWLILIGVCFFAGVVMNRLLWN